SALPTSLTKPAWRSTLPLLLPFPHSLHTTRSCIRILLIRTQREMTAAMTRRHKRRVAPGSSQNKRCITTQNTQSHNTGSASNSGSGDGPNDLGKQAPAFAGNEAPAPARSLA
ncbi:hypothetical protein GQ54DRAFT_301037, partial [Martensiomyces pterosporus]